MNYRTSSHSTQHGQCVEVGDWRKSSRSTVNGQCVEVSSGVAIRDTKDRDGGTLQFTPDAWSSFVADLRH